MAQIFDRGDLVPASPTTPDLSRRPSQFSSATNERAEPAYVLARRRSRLVP